MIRKSAWLLSAGFAVLATSAFAQDAPPTTDTGKPTTAPPTQGSTSQAAAVQNKAKEQQPVDTSDIVITATRRNEALSDVPMAVSAVTAQTLRNTGATDIRQLNQVAPSLLVSSTSSEGGAAVARIRGIGTVGDNPGLEGSVGIFVDGVYRARAGVGLTELGPLDRIEVLRGPARHVVRPQHVGRPHFDHHREAAVSAGSQRSGRHRQLQSAPLRRRASPGR